MAKRKSSTKQNRNAECAKIQRDKTKRKQWRSFKRKSLFTMLVVLAVYGTLDRWWQSGMERTTSALDATRNGFWQLTIDAGFAVDELTVAGRKDTPRGTVEEAIAVAKGDALLALDLDAIRERLTAIPEIASASVERTLPNHVHIQLQERQPVAIWQQDSVQQLIDAEGTVLTHLDVATTQKALPVITGDKAADAIDELVALWQHDAHQSDYIKAAQRVGNRRWDVHLENGLVVMLPETDTAKAWQRVVQMIEREELLSKNIEAIDFRLKDRIFIRMDTATRTLLYEGPGQET